MKKSLQHGFTVVELMVAVTVLGILTSLAVPAFINVTNTNKVTASSNELLTALSYTRSEAVKRANPVAICPANSAFTGCTASTDWSTGWIVFTDEGGTIGVVDGGEAVLQTWPAQSGLTVTTNANFVRFLRDGSRDGTAPDPTISLSKSTYARCVTVTKPGRSKVTKVLCP